MLQVYERVNVTTWEDEQAASWHIPQAVGLQHLSGVQYGSLLEIIEEALWSDDWVCVAGVQKGGHHIAGGGVPAHRQL